VITGIRNKIVDVRQTLLSPVRDNNLEFYSDIAEQCGHIKDIWRNSVSHARKPYNAAEALGVITRVRDFMVKLATDLRRAR